jgi:hypothetical protein
LPCSFEAKFEPRSDSSSTSIIVLSEGRLLSPCPEDDGGLYVDDGRKSKDAIFVFFDPPNAAEQNTAGLVRVKMMEIGEVQGACVLCEMKDY